MRERYDDVVTCVQCGWNSDVLTVPMDVRREMVHTDGTLKSRRRQPVMKVMK